MSYKIRWSKKDEERISNIVRRFNMKVGRLLKKEPSLKQVLPEKITKDKFKDNIYSRNDFLRKIKHYERFLKRGAEDLITLPSGLITTAWHKREAKISASSITRKRAKESERRSKIEITDYGAPTGFYYTPKQGKSYSNELRPRSGSIEKIKTRKEFSEFFKMLEKQDTEDYFQKKARIYKQNYIKKFEDVFGYVPEDLMELFNKFSDIQFADTLYSDENLDIRFLYQEEYLGKLNPLMMENRFEQTVSYLEDLWSEYASNIEGINSAYSD